MALLFPLVILLLGLPAALYRLTDKGRKVAAMFVLFHQRVCGPLANTLFHHQTRNPGRPARLKRRITRPTQPFRSSSSCFLEPVDGRNVGMIQRGEHFRFALKACQPLGVRRQRRRQDFDGNLTLQLRVGRPIHLVPSPLRRSVL